MHRFWNLVPGEVSELTIDGEISTDSWFGDTTSSKEFIAALAKCKDVNVKISSPGGDVFAASEIYAALHDHKYTVYVEIVSIAASAASVIAMAGDHVRMQPTAMMMIHDPLTCTYGNAKDHRDAIALLTEAEETLINAYELKTGLSREKIRSMLAKETWMSPHKAMQLGFVDEVIGYDPADAAEPDDAEEPQSAYDFTRMNDRARQSVVAALRRQNEAAPEAKQPEAAQPDADALRMYTDALQTWAQLN